MKHAGEEFDCRGLVWIGLFEREEELESAVLERRIDCRGMRLK
jgi:hypothetical protein